METILPHKNNYLAGHEDAEKVFLNAWNNNTLHNSWLITGSEGIGKATLAYRFARFLLSADTNKRGKYLSLEIDEANPVFRLVSNLSHPDLKVIERDYIETDKKKIIKAIKEGDALDDEELQSLKKSQVIKVDDIRTINDFLSKKSFDGNWRIVLVDSIDDLNAASANAILKILEEPPAKSIILLVSHNPNRLLPTIRSRCAKLNLQPLPKETVSELLRRYRPQLSERQISGLAEISGGSIGQAINFADNNGLELYEKLESLFYAKDRFDIITAMDVCESAARNENIWSLTANLIGRFLMAAVNKPENAGQIKPLGAVWEKSNRMIQEAESLNMDKKQVLLNIIADIGKAL